MQYRSPGLGRPVVEDVTQVTAAAAADDLGAAHEQAVVRPQLDRLGDRGLVKLGHPVPESNLASELNSSLPQPAHR